MKSSKLCNIQHLIETTYPINERGRFTFQMYKGKVEYVDEPYLHFMIDWTLERVERWFEEKEAAKRLKEQSAYQRCMEQIRIREKDTLKRWAEEDKLYNLQLQKSDSLIASYKDAFN